VAEKMLTKRGHERLTAEYEDLSLNERPKVVKGVSDAAAEGDRSENAEYIYGKKKLREIDKRLQYLANLMKGAKVIDPATLRSDKVQFGATVVIEDEDGEQKTWTIVGEGEADLKERTISYNAPVAKALLGKQVGDYVTIVRPAGELEVEVIDLYYGAPS
jgi:transcription elongation factor GreB